MTVASWRYVAIATSDKHLRKASKIWKQRLDNKDKDNEAVVVEEKSKGKVDQAQLDIALIKQTGHGKRTAIANYTINKAFFKHLGPDLVSAYSQASRA